MVTLLTCRGMHVAYDDGVDVVVNVDLDLAGGELVAVVGPNGAGKSSMLDGIAGLAPNFRGEVHFGEDADSSLSSKRRALRVALLPQRLDHLPAITVGTFAAAGRYPHRRGFLGTDPDGADVVAKVLDETDLASFEDRLLGELSGGQIQRVLLARALAQGAETLLVDEPTSSLDPRFQLETFERLRRFASRDRGALVVTHDLNLAAQFADRVLLLNEGRLAAAGPPEEVLAPASLEAVYGDVFLHGTSPTSLGVRPWSIPWRTN